MAATRMTSALAVIAALCGAASAHAQQPAAQQPAAQQPAAPEPPRAPAPDPKLMFDREVYSYAGGARRDPFKALVGKESLGPLFDDLKLRGIIFSPDPNLSLVLLQDGSRRLYRLHRGEIVGNSRVVEIKPLSVRFAVENFGLVRYEMLQLEPGKKTPTGQTQVSAASAPQAPGAGIDVSKLDPVQAKQVLEALVKAQQNSANKTDKAPSKPETRQ